MNNDWIKINRNIVSHWIWDDAERLKWWLDLLFMASPEDKETYHDSHRFTLKRGQMIASTSRLAKRWNCSRPTVIKFLGLLELENMVKRATLYRQTATITICNYDSYQASGDSSVDTIVDTITEVGSSVDTINSNSVDTIIDTITYCECESYQQSATSSVDTIVDTIVDTTKERNENKENKEKERTKEKEIKENKEKKENLLLLLNAQAREKINEVVEQLKNEGTWSEAVCMQFHITPLVLADRLDEYCTHCITIGETEKTVKEAKRHFANWLRTLNRNTSNGTNGTTGGDNGRAERDAAFQRYIVNKLTSPAGD